MAARIWVTDVVKEAFLVFMFSPELKSGSETPQHGVPNDLSSKCFHV